MKSKILSIVFILSVFSSASVLSLEDPVAPIKQVKQTVTCSDALSHEKERQINGVEVAGNNVCCCETIDGNKCCNNVLNCGGPIPGCNCK